MKVTFLGSGASSGTPSIEHGWGRCDPENPKNRRTRPSVLISDGGIDILIDTSPDLREQLLREKITKLDAVILSHSHADHLHGIDDIRGINRQMNAAIDLWAADETLETVEQRFPYVLQPLREGATGFYKPTLNGRRFAAFEPFQIGHLQVQPLAQDHGFSTSYGFRIGDLAYTTDFVRLGEQALDTLKGVGTWIIGTFGWDSHPTHLHVDGAMALRAKINPGQMVLTHLSPMIDYKVLENYLPEGARPAYDGLTIDV